MYNIYQKKIYIKHYNIIRASHGKLTSIQNRCDKWKISKILNWCTWTSKEEIANFIAGSL